jgi:acyl-CoA thioester hydrolase
VALSIGRSSFTLGHGLFRGESCVGTAETVMVLIDATTRRSTPLSEVLREHLETVLVRQVTGSE